MAAPNIYRHTEREDKNRNMSTGNERKSSSSASPPPDCDVGLGLKMQLQPTESYTCDVGGGGPLFSYSGNRVSDIAHRTNSGNALLFPGGFQSASLRPSGGKSLFTEVQWQELERQNLIHRYMMASIPVPPQLLFLPHHHVSSFAQCNMSPGLDLRFGSGVSSDPEPWRCKRTDGKKWRCSRDVAPDQKYCERHAHKSKPRSRKHVEISSPSPSQSPSPSPILPPNHPFQRSQTFPSMASSYEQTRSIEWFMRGGNSKPQQQTMQTPSPRSEPDDYDEKQGFYIPDTSNLRPENHHHRLDSPQTTRHFFIDAWEKDIALDMGISNKIKKLSPSSSLSLSMSGYNANSAGISYDQDDIGVNESLGIGMMSSASGSWMNSLSSPPGGPLGEALCLGGSAGATRGGLNLASPYSNSSKSSCEDGSHALNFIG